jgi:hypothetical protein
MPKYKISFSTSGSSHIIVEAENEADAEDIFLSGDWIAANEDWEEYDIDDIDVVDDATPLSSEVAERSGRLPRSPKARLKE